MFKKNVLYFITLILIFEFVTHGFSKPATQCLSPRLILSGDTRTTDILSEDIKPSDKFITAEEAAKLACKDGTFNTIFGVPTSHKFVVRNISPLGDEHFYIIIEEMPHLEGDVVTGVISYFKKTWFGKIEKITLQIREKYDPSKITPYMNREQIFETILLKKLGVYSDTSNEGRLHIKKSVVPTSQTARVIIEDKTTHVKYSVIFKFEMSPSMEYYGARLLNEVFDMPVPAMVNKENYVWIQDFNEPEVAEVADLDFNLINADDLGRIAILDKILLNFDLHCGNILPSCPIDFECMGQGLRFAEKASIINFAFKYRDGLPGTMIKMGIEPRYLISPEDHAELGVVSKGQFIQGVQSFLSKCSDPELFDKLDKMEKIFPEYAYVRIIIRGTMAYSVPVPFYFMKLPKKEYFKYVRSCLDKIRAMSLQYEISPIGVLVKKERKIPKHSVSIITENMSSPNDGLLHMHVSDLIKTPLGSKFLRDVMLGQKNFRMQDELVRLYSFDTKAIIDELYATIHKSRYTNLESSFFARQFLDNFKNPQFREPECRRISIEYTMKKLSIKNEQYNSYDLLEYFLDCFCNEDFLVRQQAIIALMRDTKIRLSALHRILVSEGNFVILQSIIQVLGKRGDRTTLPYLMQIDRSTTNPWIKNVIWIARRSINLRNEPMEITAVVRDIATAV